MNPALRANQFRIKDSLPSFHSLFFPFAPQEILSTHSYLPQISFLLYYIGSISKVIPTPLPVCLFSCLPKIRYSAAENVVPLHFTSNKYRVPSEGWGTDLLFCTQTESALIQQQYPKYVIENALLIISSMWQSYQKTVPIFFIQKLMLFHKKKKKRSS